LKHRFHITEETKSNFLNTLFQLIPKNRQHARAIEYLKSYSESFWKDTEERVREIKSTFENQLTGSVNGLIPNIGGLSAAAGRKLSEEQRSEIVNRAQEVVNRVQVAELTHVIELLDTVLLKDHQKKYYVLIDGLDADWAEDRIRFRLIRALIETTLEFTRVHNVKIIIALRNDLIDRVYKYARVAGFQEEKYRTSTLQISWTRPQLVELLDARISHLVREQYTGKSVTHEDLLVKHIGKRKGVDYILDRTLMRPRDAIQFFNTCIRQADGEPLISKNALLEAEGVYSRERIRALADEWLEIYPNIIHLSGLLKRRKQTFFLNEITPKQLEENYLELLLSGRGPSGLDLSYMNMVFNGNMTVEDYRVNIILILHKVGMVGLKTDVFNKFSWSESGEISVSSAEILPETKVMVHPMFWRCLGIDYIEEKDDT